MVDPVVDASVLRRQYGDGAGLAARQALWRSRPGPSLYATAVGQAGLTGRECVVDVGCGNGAGLAELRRRGHAGPVLGLDRSPGMARESGAHASTAVADAAALPLRDGAVDVVLSLHMLYHVPDIAAALAEFRRVLRPGGRVVATTNSADHVAEPDALLRRAIARVTGSEPAGGPGLGRFDERSGPAYLSAAFERVAVVDAGATVEVTEPAILTGYLASYSPELFGLERGPQWSAVRAQVEALVAEHFARQGSFAVTSGATVLIGHRG